MTRTCPFEYSSHKEFSFESLSGLPTYRYNTADAGRNVIWRIVGGCDGKNAVHG